MSLPLMLRSDRIAASCRLEGNMPNSELSNHYPHDGEASASSEPGSEHDDLKIILDAIASQLSDADRRHSATLSEMQNRIAGMEHETEMLRNHVPQQFAPAFDRIETGVAELSQRLAGLSDAKAAQATESGSSEDHKADIPMALRSALEPHDKGARQLDEEASRRSFGIDPFDVIESSLPGDAADPWDRASADALSGLYESGAANLGPKPAISETTAAASGKVTAIDQNWLESRFAEIAKGIEQSLADIRPDHGFYAIGQRLDQFEDHFTKLFEGVATQADIGAVRLIEAHVGEVVNHLVQTHDQLARLNVIEEQLALISHTLAEVQSGAHPTRFLDNGSAADELRPLIERLMSDNRQGEENTAALLDTLQHAMIRLLDRVDSIESAQRQRFNPNLTPRDYEFDRMPSTAEPRHASDMIEDSEIEAIDAAVAAVASAKSGRPHRPEAPIDFSSAEQHDFAQRKNEKLRQDFVAEARRAKMRLAATEPDEIIIESPQARRAAESAEAAKILENKGNRPIRPPTATAKPTGPSGPSPRLIVIAVAAIAVLTGLWFSLGSGSDRPVPAQPAALMSPSHPVQSAEPAKTAPDQTNKSATPAEDTGRRGEATPPSDNEGRVVPSSAPAEATTLPLLGIAVDTGRPVTQSDLQMAKRRQAMAVLSGEIGHAAARASEPTVVPASMVPTEGETTGATDAEHDDVTPNGVSRSMPLDMPAATVGPLSLRLAAAHGDPSAEFEVGARFAEGKGMQQNFKDAAKWYQLSADRGFAQAQYRLGTFYERGFGVKADRARAAAWYQRAAEQGNIKAMHNLAVLSANQTDESPDYTTAARWFEEAAKRGLGDSQFNLAVLYENGLGVKRDMKKAFMWLALAARDGDKDALRRRDILRGKLTAEEIGAAEQLVANWKPVPADRMINDPRVAGEAWKKNPQNGVSG
jgi:localization factor PodJL